MQKLVVLISGAGSNLEALLEELDASRRSSEPIDAEVVSIGADTPCDGLALAERYGIPSFVVRPREFEDRAAWGDALLERIRSYEPDLTILSGFMRLVPPRVVVALSPALLNTHPAYLPEFPGAHAVRDALAAGASRTGASLIVVDDGVDTGPVVARTRIDVRADDTEATLHARIKVAERRLLADAVRRIASGDLDLATLAAEPADAAELADREPTERAVTDHAAPEPTPTAEEHPTA